MVENSNIKDYKKVILETNSNLFLIFTGLVERSGVYWVTYLLVYVALQMEYYNR